jgi:acetaldehyde dehydrogenase/alcohol dehydrogenase
MGVTNEQELNDLIERVKIAQAEFATFSQSQVDRIFQQAAIAANEARIPLAKLAVEETGMGIVEDKVIKNHFASEMIYNKYKNEKTCGVIEEDKHFGIQKIAEPVGIVAGIVPTTNPTSTTIFKALLAIKTRNAIIFSPHPRAKACTIEAARIVLRAAVAAGAPDPIIGWIDEPTVPLSQALMQHPEIKLILATGGPGMVKAAYSSGHPSLGVGAGNTPALIDVSADIPMAVSSILLSKTFDNGMICASEQAVIVVQDIYERVKEEFIFRGSYILSPEEVVKLRQIILQDGRLNPAIVGQSVERIAELAGFTVPLGTRLLIGEVEEVGPQEPFSYEKLSPILAMYRVPNFRSGVEIASQLVNFGGKGHTAVLYTDPANRDDLAYFEHHVAASRVLLNTPSSQGAIGDLYNFKLDPSLTLGCGTWGGNSISENVAPHHLLNIKTVTERRENMLWFRVPPKIYFKFGCLPVALQELKGKRRAFLVTDKPLFDMGMLKEVEEVLEELEIEFQTFYEVEPDPTLSTVEKGLARCRSFNPDVIIAFGGGSPMDAAKVIWLMYEHPEVEFAGIAMRFMDIRKRVYALPTLGQKAILVAIPTTSGTGSEVTPFAVVTDDKTGIKYPLADYALTPTMAIVDPELVMNMPKKLTAYGGLMPSPMRLKPMFPSWRRNLPRAWHGRRFNCCLNICPGRTNWEPKTPIAREKVHYAATIAGMAFANAFLGICHSLAHKLGSTFHVPHGLANALMISHVIRYNATDAPFKQAIFPQYTYPHAKQRYAEIADFLHLGGRTEDDKVERLINAIENLKQELDIPLSIKEVLPDREREFYESVEKMAEQAF